ncbi:MULTISPECIES: ClpP family protease [unclassified Lentimonas]|uniref:ClpP family protease n=1 Tax=unclassified Lentimonas TaxID=2630993 RepID=UPI0013207AAA|nr:MULTISPECIES: ATP-dependent Clp protease proteolytic subunit [unclassified Lentimonas]CAA6693820.1 Unannotated [Lentimonas sp. CC19]CAA6695123.1 Unannotated [Lentimonas sp. CC10]CAA7069698.1 Unannotated [Lentimonas sp. CC11]
MAESNGLKVFRTLLIFGVLIVLLWRVTSAPSVGGLAALNDDEIASDLSYLFDLLAESGNLNVRPELDEALFASRKILLTADINVNSTKLVIASLLLLNEQDPSAPIDLYVHTNGGYYDDAFAVVDAIRMSAAPVNTYAIGGCHSSGALIVASGTGVRTAYPNTILMVHDNLSEDGGVYDVDTQENVRLRAYWSEFEQLPSSWFSAAGDEMYYTNAEQALEYGLVDRVLSRE